VSATSEPWCLEQYVTDCVQKFVHASSGIYSVISLHQLTFSAAIPRRSGTSSSSHASTSSALFGRLFPGLSGCCARWSSSRCFPTRSTAGWLFPAPSTTQSERGFPQPTVSCSPLENFGLHTGPEKLRRPAIADTAGLQRRVPVHRPKQRTIREQRGLEQRHDASVAKLLNRDCGIEIEAYERASALSSHTCSVCKRMRSAGYHRSHPVVPGRPPNSSPCRKCKKKIESQGRSRSSYTRIRSCTAEKPCDWPRESVHIDVEIDREERRGRQRSRERVYVYRRSPTRPRVIRQSSSQTRLGLRALQQDHLMPRERINQTRMRISSLSPHRASRYDGVWPPPDVVPMKPSREERPQHMTHANPNLTSRDEVWPPPDVVRTHSYRKVSVSPIRRQSSRIIELSPSPPPLRRQSSRVEIRSESLRHELDSVTIGEVKQLKRV
jgi:hypothetical protein